MALYRCTVKHILKSHSVDAIKPLHLLLISLEDEVTSVWTRGMKVGIKKIVPEYMTVKTA